MVPDDKKEATPPKPKKAKRQTKKQSAGADTKAKTPKKEDGTVEEAPDVKESSEVTEKPKEVGGEAKGAKPEQKEADTPKTKEGAPETKEADQKPEGEEAPEESPVEPLPPAPVNVVEKPAREGDWTPKTRLGRMVRDGEISSMGDALKTGYPLREPEIVDILLPDLDDEVLDVNMVQRMTDSGRRVRFAIVTVVGNSNGYVGLGKATGKEVGPAIRKAIDNAKVNLIEIKRGCGSWECGCGAPHSLPFVVHGKSGSAVVTFKPAPRGISLAVGDVAKHVLRLAGIEDAWGFTAGKTRTTVNYAKAAFDALKKISEMRVMEEQELKLHIHSGGISKIQEGEEE
jgi:small subunit ribosomal protein S5